MDDGLNKPTQWRNIVHLYFSLPWWHPSYPRSSGTESSSRTVQTHLNRLWALEPASLFGQKGFAGEGGRKRRVEHSSTAQANVH
jgi:hypothetical protein